VSPKLPEELDKVSIDFLCSFLVKNPKQRSTFNSTKQHAFWKDLNFDQVLNKEYTPEFVPQKSGSIEKDCQNCFFHNENENLEIENSKEIFRTFEHFSFVSESY
jgi:hypothetical protein